MTNEEIKDRILKTGVQNLKEYGYLSVTEETILTDEIHKEFFRDMLKSNLGITESVDIAINELLKQIA